MKITWHGHAFIEIQVDGITLLGSKQANATTPNNSYSQQPSSSAFEQDTLLNDDDILGDDGDLADDDLPF